jgi:putative nucleotidyltransferase with HDIG domain
MHELLLAKPARPWALRLLPPFPAVANRILGLVGNESIGANQISDIIKLDPTFTAEILRVANSALFGLTGTITSVNHAVSLLGLERVRAMATLVALNSMVKNALRIEALRKVWKHSLVAAVLCEEAAKVSAGVVDIAYTAGLLHNLGTLGLMAAYPDEYTQMLDVSREYGYDLLQTERDLFDIDHCAAGAWLAREWNFPEEIAAAIATHHDNPAPGDASLNGLVRISWLLADTLGYIAFAPEKSWTYDELTAMIPGAPKSWLGQGIDGARREVESRLSSLGL